MSRFDRRLKGVNNKSKGGSGAACVPQPIPTRAPLLSGMMFGGGIRRPVQNNVTEISPNLQSRSLDGLVNEVSNKSNNSTGEIINNNSIEMMRRRISRLENTNTINAKANKVYESLNTRLTSLEKMYSENMENMEKYVRNQEDRINLLTADYRKTLETLNKIIKDVNTKIIEIDETTIKKSANEEKIEEVKIEEVEIEEPEKTIVAVKAKPVINKEETNDEVIAEVTEEILVKVSQEQDVKQKNVSLMITEKEESIEN